MKYLLDTQILVWSLEDNPSLHSRTKALIENPDDIMLFTPISLMELSIKLKLGKLPQFIVSIEEITNQLITDGFDLLPIHLSHIYTYQTVQLFEDHRDPFDRFLLETALAEQIPIISSDEKFSRYAPNITVLNT